VNTDTLLSICEIAAALAGFAAIVTVLDRTKSLESWVRLQSVLLICILVIAAALVPVLLIEYQVGPDALYRISAAVFFTLIWLTIYVINQLSKKAGGNIRKNVGGLYSNLVMWTMEFCIQMPLVLCIVGLLSTYHSAFYLTALIVNLLQAVQFFYTLAMNTRLKEEN